MHIFAYLHDKSLGISSCLHISYVLPIISWLNFAFNKLCYPNYFPVCTHSSGTLLLMHYAYISSAFVLIKICTNMYIYIISIYKYSKEVIISVALSLLQVCLTSKELDPYLASFFQRVLYSQICIYYICTYIHMNICIFDFFVFSFLSFFGKAHAPPHVLHIFWEFILFLNVNNTVVNSF